MRRFLSVSCAMCALLIGLAVPANAQEIGQSYQSAVITRHGDQMICSTTVSGHQSPDIAAAAVKSLTELAQQFNGGQHLGGGSWSQSELGKPYFVKIMMPSAAKTKAVLPAAVQELALISNCTIGNSHLRITATPALVKKFQAMTAEEIMAVVKADEKEVAKDGELSAIRQTCIQMVCLGAWAHSFPVGAEAERIVVKDSQSAGVLDIEVVFAKKYVAEKKAQSATLSVFRAQRQFAPIPVPQSKG